VASTIWFEVRRRAWRQGHFQEERWGRRGAGGAITGNWRPVGTVAVEAMLRYAGSRRVVEQWRAEGLSINGDTPPRKVAIFWRVALDGFVEGGTAPDINWSRGVFPYWFDWIPPRGSRGEMVQPFFLPLNAEAGAISLSAVFAMVSGNLWICRGCHQPFRRSSTARKCADCQRTDSLKTAAGLPREIVRGVWRPFRKRLDLRVLRGTMRPKERDKLKMSGLRGLRDVDAGRRTLTDWREHFESYNSVR
jgi:hypothetical protein